MAENTLAQNIAEAIELVDSYRGIVQGGSTLVTFPKGITRIRDNVCTGLTQVTDIDIPDTVVNIGASFQQMDSLKNVTLGNGVRYIDDYAFRDTLFEKLNIKSLEDYLKITFVYSDSNPLSKCSLGLFLNWVKLENVTIPNNITTILPFALYRCKSLKSVTVPDNVTKISVGAFAYCDNLETITIGNGVTKIGAGNGEQAGTGSFQDCTSLTSVSLGNGLKSIGGTVFGMCSSLPEIKIPSSVTYIGNYAFEGCTSLASIDMTDFDVSSQTFYIPMLLTGAFNSTPSNKKFYFKDQATLNAFANHVQWGRYSSYFEVDQTEVTTID